MDAVVVADRRRRGARGDPRRAPRPGSPSASVRDAGDAVIRGILRHGDGGTELDGALDDARAAGAGNPPPRPGRRCPAGVDRAAHAAPRTASRSPSWRTRPQTLERHRAREPSHARPQPERRDASPGQDWHRAHVEALTPERAGRRHRPQRSMGSWRFVAGFLVFMVIWAAANVMALAWDPYPFILLNLFLSMLAGLQGAILLIAAKRQDAIAAALAQHDYETNIAAKREVEELMEDQPPSAPAADRSASERRTLSAQSGHGAIGSGRRGAVPDRTYNDPAGSGSRDQGPTREVNELDDGLPPVGRPMRDQHDDAVGPPLGCRPSWPQPSPRRGARSVRRAAGCRHRQQRTRDREPLTLTPRERPAGTPDRARRARPSRSVEQRSEARPGQSTSSISSSLTGSVRGRDEQQVRPQGRVEDVRLLRAPRDASATRPTRRRRSAGSRRRRCVPCSPGSPPSAPTAGSTCPSRTGPSTTSQSDRCRPHRSPGRRRRASMRAR